MSFIKNIFKLFIAIGFDTADFFIGRIPIWGTFFDIVGGFLGLVLWGPLGSAQFLEIFDITDQIDGFIPTLTIAGLYILFRGD
jgi:hypothetical protein